MTTTYVGGGSSVVSSSPMQASYASAPSTTTYAGVSMQPVITQPATNMVMQPTIGTQVVMQPSAQVITQAATIEATGDAKKSSKKKKVSSKKKGKSTCC